MYFSELAGIFDSNYSYCYRHRENFWAFTRLRIDFGLILLISDMIIHRSFTGPTHLLSANVWGPISFAVSAAIASWLLRMHFPTFVNLQGFSDGLLAKSNDLRDALVAKACSLAVDESRVYNWVMKYWVKPQIINIFIKYTSIQHSLSLLLGLTLEILWDIWSALINHLAWTTKHCQKSMKANQIKYMFRPP